MTKKISQLPNITVVNDTTCIPVITGLPLKNAKIPVNSLLTNVKLNGTLTLNGVEIKPNTGDTNTSLDGTNYIMVYGVGTPEENAAELLTAYEAAKNMPRYIGDINSSGIYQISVYKGQTLHDTATNTYGIVGVTQENIMVENIMYSDILDNPEITAKSVKTTLIVAPGKYTFNNPNDFIIDTSYIDIVSLTGNRDVQINGIKVTAGKEVLVKGIDCGIFNITLANCVNNTLVIENCKGGDNSFNTAGTDNLTGTFINCEGGDYSFNAVSLQDTIGNSILNGTKFINCTAGDYSFGFNSKIEDTVLFESCSGGNCSFSANNINYTNQSEWLNHIITGGIYNKCKSLGNSFGYRRQLTNAVFNECTGGHRSFGSTSPYTEIGAYYLHDNTKFTKCIGGDGSFCTSTGVYNYNSSSKVYFTDCTGGNLSFFGHDSESEETLSIEGVEMINCTAGHYSFCYNPSYDGNNGYVINVKLTNCIGGNYSFCYDTIDNGANGSDNVELHNCIGGENSFFVNQTNTNTKLYYCKGGANSNIVGTSKHIFCIVNNSAIANN